MRWLLPLLLATAAARAQSVLSVPGMFPQIHQALAAAQRGDVIEVANGIYQPFVVTAGVTIRGTGTAAPSVPLGGPVTFDIPQGEQAYVFQMNLYTGTQVQRGSVAFERCRFDGPPAGLEIAPLGECILMQCSLGTVVGPRDGARVRGRLAAMHTNFGGGASWVQLGGTAVVVDGGSVQFANCRIRGGPAVLPQHPATDALVVLAGSAWLADCTVAGGDSQVSAGGVGIRNQGNAAVHGARTSVTGGAGTVPGAATVGPYVTTADLLSLWQVLNGLARGGSSALRPIGPTGMPVFYCVGLRAEAVTHPLLAAPSWLGAGGHLLGVGVLDAAGQEALPIAVPNLTWLRDVRLFFQVYGLDGQTILQSTPPLACLVQ
ncbi:MAG: hypothetical protein IPK26_08600 [Planctomycetes bacterium]|nr:hypothetical protein [Planctomycetota bacterium]